MQLSRSFQVKRIYYFRRSTTASSAASPDASAYTALAEQQNLIRQLKQWPRALECLIISLGNVLSEEMLYRVAVLKLKQKTTKIILASLLQEDESNVYREFEQDLRDIVSLARSSPTSKQPDLTRSKDPRHCQR